MEYSTLSNVKNSADSISSFLTPLDKRQAYDECNQKTRLKESVKQGSYHLNDEPINNETCYFDYQHMSGRGLPIKSVVDLESELRGITHINSKCDDQRLKRKSVFKKGNNLKTIPYCSDFLTATDTRVTRSCSSELKLDRFDYNVDDTLIHQNSYIGVNTRLETKKLIEKQDAMNAHINKRNLDLGQN